MSVNYYYIDVYEEEDQIKMLYKPDSFLLLADFNSNFNLYKTSEIEGELPKGVTELPIDLSSLIQCAEGYKPSIALVRDKISLMSNEIKNISKENFSNLYFKLLKEELENQKYNNYFLVEVVYDDSSYFSKGDFVWVIGYNPIYKVLHWVSFDFFVYKDPIKNFKINLDLLDKLPVYTEIL